MASGNGSWVNSGSYGMRLTWTTTQSPSSVSSGTSSVTVRLRVYVEAKNAISDTSNTFKLSGGTFGSSWPEYSGSVSVSIPSGGGTELIYDETITVSTVYESTVTKAFSASLTGINIIPGTATVSGSHTVGPRPVSYPTAPGTPTVSRTSDKSHTISAARNATSAAPYNSQQLQRRTWNAGTGSWGSWVLIMTNGTRYTSSGTTSFTDTSTVANRTYGYRVVAINGTGSVNSAASANVNTTPGVASSMAAARSGTDIVVTGSDSPISVNRSAVTYSWQDNPNQSGWVGVGGTTASPNRTFTGVNTSQTHQYRVAASVSSGTTNATTLTGTYSAATGIVQLLSPPLAPTLVSPTGGVLERGVALNFSWIHNPVDSTSQRAYQVRYRYDGGSWTYLTGTSSSVLAFVPTDSSVTLEWGVRTKGQYTTSPTDNEYGPWSTTASVLLRARPTALITSPVDPWSQGRAVLAWVFDSADSAAQASWEASLWSDGAQVSTTLTGTTATTVTFNVELTQSTTYTVHLRVRDSNGLWSLVETQTFTVAFTPPLLVTLDVGWDTVQAAVQLTPEIVAGAGDPVDSISIQRLSEDGVEWVTIIDYVPASSQYFDRLALLGDNTYRALSWSSNMAVTEGTPVVISWVHDRCPVFVNGGDGYLLQGRALAQSVNSAPDKESALYYWEDVRLPDAIYGIQTSETISVSASLRDGDGRATPAWVWRELLYAGRDVCYRDCGESHGDFPRRVFGRLKVSSTSQSGSSSRTINFSIEQTGTTEGILGGE